MSSLQQWTERASPVESRRNLQPHRLVWIALLAGSLTLPALTSCAAQQRTQRFVDAPQGETEILGAPKNRKYYFNAEPSQDKLVLTVYQRAECDVIKVKLVSRTEETLRGDEVVARSEPRILQQVQGVQGTKPCEETFARDQMLSMRVGNDTQRLGVTSARGELALNLNSTVLSSLYGNESAAEARLMVEGLDVGAFPLVALRQYQARVNELVASFRALVEKDQLSQAEIAQSYELYEQLRQLAPKDARVSGLQARFLEQLYGRQQEEDVKNLKRNLEALNEARNVLQALAASGANVPAFVRVAIETGNTDPDAIRWARTHLALTARGDDGICSRGEFRWANLTRDFPRETQLSLQFLRYVYNDPFELRVRTLCNRLGK